MSRRLMKEGLKALREANQDHIPSQYFGPPTKATFTMPSNHDMNPSMPRDEIKALMSRPDFRKRPSKRLHMPPNYTQPPNPPSKLPPRRAPEGFGNQFKRPSKNP